MFLKKINSKVHEKSILLQTDHSKKNKDIYFKIGSFSLRQAESSFYCKDRRFIFTTIKLLESIKPTSEGYLSNERTTQVVTTRVKAETDIVRLTKLLVKSRSFRNKQMRKIKLIDETNAILIGRIKVDRRLSPTIDETHPFKNKRGRLATKRNKRMQHFFRTIRSLSSQLFVGHKVKELATRRRRRHFKFFGKIRVGVLDAWERGRISYSTKNERVRWGYNLIKFKKKRVFYYKLSSRVFFRKYFGFSNNTKVGNFQAPLRRSPTGYLRFFTFYKKKPFTFVRSMRWLRSAFSFSNMRLSKNLIFVSCYKFDSVFRPVNFWEKKTKVNSLVSKYSASDLFIMTKPTARTLFFSELDFFKKKMVTILRNNEPPIVSKWFIKRKINFFECSKRPDNNQIVNKKKINFNAIYSNNNSNNQERTSKMSLYQYTRSTASLSDRVSKAPNIYQSDIFFKIGERILRKYNFSFFFKNTIRYFYTDYLNEKSSYQTFFKNCNISNSRLFLLINIIKEKLEVLEKSSVQTKLLTVFDRIRDSNDAKVALFNKKLPVISLKCLNLRKRKKIKTAFLGLETSNKRAIFNKKNVSFLNLKKTSTIDKNNNYDKKLALNLIFLKRINYTQLRYKNLIAHTENFRIKSLLRNNDNFLSNNKGKQIVAGRYKAKNVFGEKFYRKLNFFKLFKSSMLIRQSVLSLHLLKLNKLIRSNKSGKLNKKYLKKKSLYNRDLQLSRYSSIVKSIIVDKPVKEICTQGCSSGNDTAYKFFKKLMYNISISNLLVFFRLANKTINFKILNLINDSRDSSLYTLKFLLKFKDRFSLYDTSPQRHFTNTNFKTGKPHLKFFEIQTNLAKKELQPFEVLKKKYNLIKRPWWKKWSKLLRLKRPGNFGLKKPHVYNNLHQIIKMKSPALLAIKKGGIPWFKKTVFRKRGWVYEPETHSFVRKNKIKKAKDYIDEKTSIFSYKTYQKFLKQEQLKAYKERLYGLSTYGGDTPNFFFNSAVRVKEYSLFVKTLRGLILPFWFKELKTLSIVENTSIGSKKLHAYGVRKEAPCESSFLFYFSALTHNRNINKDKDYGSSSKFKFCRQANKLIYNFYFGCNLIEFIVKFFNYKTLLKKKIINLPISKSINFTKIFPITYTSTDIICTIFNIYVHILNKFN